MINAFWASGGFRELGIWLIAFAGIVTIIIGRVLLGKALGTWAVVIGLITGVLVFAWPKIYDTFALTFGGGA